MKYMLLIHEDDEERVEQMDERLPACMAYVEAMKKAGIYVGGERLREVAATARVRVRDGVSRVLDGPYAETREQLAGFHIIDVPGRDEALAWAARCPSASRGSVEVRPVWPVAGDAQTEAPSATRSLCPHLVCAGAAAAIEFYEKAFGAIEQVRVPGPGGRLMHACVLIHGSPVMLVDEFREHGSLAPSSLGGSPVTIHLGVDDVDACTARAVAAGARVVMPVADMFWGDRYGVIEDPFGHRWSIATPKRQLSERELQAAARAHLEAAGDPT